jgi:hypothetical protein
VSNARDIITFLNPKRDHDPLSLRKQKIKRVLVATLMIGAAALNLYQVGTQVAFGHQELKTYSEIVSRNHRGKLQREFIAITTVVFLTSGTTYTRPVDWNNSSNTIECIGGGQGGGNLFCLGCCGAYGGAGGQGGGYSRSINLSIGTTAAYAIGAAGGTPSVAGGSTSFNSGTVFAPGGGTGAGFTANNAAFAGGNGGAPGSLGAGGSGSGAGGGGAGGKNGAGVSGAPSSTGDTVNGQPGGAGDAGAGGGGGGSGSGGGNGNEYGGGIGSGGGGGGGGGGASVCCGGAGPFGAGPGGFYGGGGGGSPYATNAPNVGRQGIIIISYLPIRFITPSLYTNSSAFYSATLKLKLAILNPSLFAPTSVFYTHNIQRNLAVLVPSLFAPPSVLYAPTARYSLRASLFIEPPSTLYPPAFKYRQFLNWLVSARSTSAFYSPIVDPNPHSIFTIIGDVTTDIVLSENQVLVVNNSNDPVIVSMDEAI